MENEIIIDGVNVAECNDIYGKEWINPQCLGDGAGWCKDHPNCYFKQLQRIKANIDQLKKENEELHLKYAGCKTANTGINELNSELKTENEELKAKIETYVCSANCYKYIEANKYKQALEEVRDRIKGYHLKVGGEVVGADTIYDIEKKISEVLDA